jgi:GTP cyclohydrolase III
MHSAELDNLAKIGKLKREPPSASELEGLHKSAMARLADAAHRELSFHSRFDLAYNAAHALALYALRRLGYRSDNRYLVFQTLVHTVGLPPETARVLAKAHERRNMAEYEGVLEADERLMSELVAAATRLRTAIEALPPLGKAKS